MTSTLTLGDRVERVGFDVLGHLERETTIPVIDGLRAQGDLIVIPLGSLADVGGLPRYQPVAAEWPAAPRQGLPHREDGVR